MGVNKYQREDEPEIDVLDIDNTAVREAQVAQPEKHSRATAMTKRPFSRQRSTALTQRRLKAGPEICWTLAVNAARARATCGRNLRRDGGQLSGGTRAVIQSISGVYGSAYEGDEDFARNSG